jgi:hypothetical protein
MLLLHGCQGSGCCDCGCCGRVGCARVYLKKHVCSVCWKLEICLLHVGTWMFHVVDWFAKNLKKLRYTAKACRRWEIISNK